MLKLRKEELNYENLQEFASYFIFISYCLPKEEVKKLKDEWIKQGGIKSKPWRKFIMENTKIELDIKQEE